MRKRLIISFTGHRPNKLKCCYDLKSEVSKVIANHIEAEVRSIIAEYPAEEYVFLTGGAIGTDQIAFWVGEKLKRNGLNLMNVVCVPCPNQESRWSDDNKLWYHHMIRRADKVVNVWENAKYAADTIRDMMQKRNEFMIDYSNFTIAVWNGLKNGGTWNCIEYALENQMPIIHINSLQILKEVK